MQRNTTNLSNKQYDLVVIGGGIFGICAAWDAALRGLSVALLERGDFGHATSANHFKVVHGGIRYLQHADLARIRESSAERTTLLRIAPHLVYPMPFVVPTYGHGLKGSEVMRVGLLLYDACTWDRNRAIQDPTRKIPRSRILSRSETFSLFPQLDSNNLTGAALFYDGQMYNPSRLSLAFIQSAVEAGADVVNYAEAVELCQNRAGDRIQGVVVHDRLTGDEFEIRGHVVLNAAGPWGPWLLASSPELHLKKQPIFSRDAYFVVKRKLVDSCALAIQGQTHDPDALINRGNRHLFLVPWRGYTLIGVWHVVHNGHPNKFTLTASEIEEFIGEIHTSNPALELTLADVSMCHAGLTLFGENEADAIHLSYGKRSILIDHEEEHGVSGLISLIGVRFTTARGMAEKAIDLVCSKLDRDLLKRSEIVHTKLKCRTAVTPIYGGDFESFDDLVSQAKAICPPKIKPEQVKALVHNHGTNFQRILYYIQRDQQSGNPIGDSTVLQAEITHAVREEMAYKLSDVVFRRTDLGTGSHPGQRALETCADLMAQELNWTKERKTRELADVESYFPNFS
ncbi:glycerol-3-phosphate dehydrogenase/oxidase [Chloroflexi bacterium TSY]|nr:glycerol-3-phosphate dehydrogenase/oxidase [Chloroflexi bacterium TSY]